MTKEAKKTSAFVKTVKRAYENGTYAVLKPVAHLVSDRLIDDTERKVKKLVGMSIFLGSVAYGIKCAAYPANAAASELMQNLDRAGSLAGGITFGGIYATVGSFISTRFVSGTKPMSGNVFNDFTKEREDSLCLRGFVEKRLKRLEKAGRTDLLDKLAEKEQKAFDKFQMKQVQKQQNDR